MAPAARVLAEAAVEVLGEAGGEASGGAGTAEAASLQGGVHGGSQGGVPGPGTSVSLRIVLNPGSMGRDVAAVEAAVDEVLRAA
eukprot:scaffold2912_cov68-Phaeocystis_antarctica.AAC.3